MKKHLCPPISDEELISHILDNPDMFFCLATRYEKPLYRYLNRLGHLSPADIEDILQEAFLKIYLNLNSFDSSLKFSSWAYRITHNTAISFFRYRSRHLSLDYQLSAPDLEILASETDLERDIDQSLDHAKLKEAINNLPLKYREVIILKFLEEKSYEEISDILKKPPGTIATLISRAKKKLHRELVSL